MAKVTSKYELMYIIDLTRGEEEVAAIAAKFKALVEANATLDEEENIGRKKLAYLIDDKPDGYYIRLVFTGPPEFPKELTRVLGITDGVMRTLLTLVE
ncbi:MAG: 30S ribosomal protein S6 [Oscillospiraceae bacterium]|nr:30S ribosomal protein S6 [Oscillospiraceae bacterium]